MTRTAVTASSGSTDGEATLAVLLRSLSPLLDLVEYSYYFVGTGNTVPAQIQAFATIQEPEGTTIVARTMDIESTGMISMGTWARISLSVHSSLMSVGLTGTLASALAAAGISANVIAGYYHDHFFVPWDRRADAFNVLIALSTS